VHDVSWKMICLIDHAIENIKLLTKERGVAQMVDSWAVKRERRHTGIATNFGTMLAIDGFLIAIFKPTPKTLGNQNVTAYFSQKGFWV
jgi:hypothetical protein